VRPGSGAREAVLADRLDRVRAERARIAAELDGLPSAEERDGLLARDAELAALERGFAVLLPEAWHLASAAPRAVGPGEDAAVLVEIRATASVLAMRLQERPGSRTRWEDEDLAAAVALFRFAHTALGDGFGGYGGFPA
jgi:hypothetical protein